jgi:cell division topological specificity factor
MNILGFFLQRRQPSASIAKERLQIVLAHERAGRDGPEFLPSLQKELLAVVAKYVEVKDDMIRVNLGKSDGTSVLEINVEFDRTNIKPDGTPPPIDTKLEGKPPEPAKPPHKDERPRDADKPKGQAKLA